MSALESVLITVRGAYPRPVLSNPVAIRHMWRQAILMWRQEGFPETVHSQNID